MITKLFVNCLSAAFLFISAANSGAASDLEANSPLDMSRSVQEISTVCPGCADAAKVVTSWKVTQCGASANGSLVNETVATSELYAFLMALMVTSPKLYEKAISIGHDNANCVDDSQWVTNIRDALKVRVSHHGVELREMPVTQ